MAKNRILIVSDSPDRQHFLEYHRRCHVLMPIQYTNIIQLSHQVVKRRDPCSKPVVSRHFLLFLILLLYSLTQGIVCSRSTSDFPCYWQKSSTPVSDHRVFHG